MKKTATFWFTQSITITYDSESDEELYGTDNIDEMIQMDLVLMREYPELYFEDMPFITFKVE
jgi:hypothetical protein